jgi:hypothetical protein
VVTTKDGSTFEVDSEFAARVAITKAGGGTYKAKK